jgi:hypothetical protein
MCGNSTRIMVHAIRRYRALLYLTDYVGDSKGVSL